MSVDKETISKSHSIIHHLTTTESLERGNMVFCKKYNIHGLTSPANISFFLSKERVGGKVILGLHNNH